MTNRIPIADQIIALAATLGLDPSSALSYAQGLSECPKYAEGWFAIPTVEALARKYFPEVTDPAERYCRAVRLVMGKLNETVPLQGYGDELIVPARLCQNERTTQSLFEIARTQPGDILVVAAQTGWYQRAKTPASARRALDENEFGLDTLAMASIALTHPDPFTWWKQRSINCLGDDLDPGAQGNYSHVAAFLFIVQQSTPIKTQACYGARWQGDTCLDGGSATGFVPH
jgi:hypothetical protein